jgi:hypothetical protein
MGRRSFGRLCIPFIIFFLLEKPDCLSEPALKQWDVQRLSGGKQNRNTKLKSGTKGNGFKLGVKKLKAAKGPLKLRKQANSKSLDPSLPLVIALLPVTRSADAQDALISIQAACGVKCEVRDQFCLLMHSLF